MRAAVYFTPPAGNLLTRAAGQWLGRSAFDGEPTRAADAAIDPLVASPARYGFHATIKAPFRLADGVDLADLDARLASFCAAQRPFTIERLVLSRLGGFFAMTPADPATALGDLEAETVRAFDVFRAPITEAEIEKRAPDRLSGREQDNLRHWGYPYVFDAFRFHMTLTSNLPEADRDPVEVVLRRRFAAFDGAPLAIDGLGLFVEPHPGAPFRVHSLHPFTADR